MSAQTIVFSGSISALFFQIKICGVRTEQDVDWVGHSKADAVGLNFHPASVRFVDVGVDVALSAAAKRHSLFRVGVFVNHTSDQILEIAARVDLDMVQLHGGQDVAWAKELASQFAKPLLRAIKLPTSPIDVATLDAAIMPWIDAGWDVLLDADGGVQHGGSGSRLHWPSIAAWHDHRRLPFALAGGIDPKNVAEAIAISGASAVDAASGTESTRGTKDQGRIEAFSAAAAEALQKPR